MIRRECIDAAGRYDVGVTLCEDWKFYTALAGVCEFAVVPEYLTGYRFRATSASMDVLRMERAIEDVTAWIRATWPGLPESVFRDRSHVVNAYLASLAIREREFAHALRFLGLALRARPSKLFAPSYVQFFFLLGAHMVGLRTYRWLFWRRPPLLAESWPQGAMPTALEGYESPC